MNHLEFLDKLIVLEKLIRKECTGTPKELANRLHISRSTVYEIIDELKLRGVEIEYSRTHCTFYYKNDVMIDIRFSIKDLTNIDNPEELKNISGGMRFFSFRPIFQTEGFYFCK